jgi:hypothetical protein
MSQHQGEVDVLHTDVPCGVVPGSEADGADARTTALIAASHPLRIDAVIRWRGAWWVVECKPQAGYQALGQLLTYGFYAPFAGEELCDARLAVLTDRVQEPIEPVYERFGVAVWEIRDLLTPA